MNNNTENKLYVLIHVDDLLIISNNSSLIQEAIKHIGKKYTLKDLGQVSNYLGINIIRNSDHSFKIHQRPKIEKLIEDLGLQDSKGTNTPMPTGFNRSILEEKSTFLPNNEKYQIIIGSLMYLSNVSRPDIAISTNILGRAVNSPTKAHWEGVKRIVKYLKETIHLDLILNCGNSTQFVVYSDADWGGGRLTGS